MNKRFVLSALLFATTGAVFAKALPPLQYFQNAQPGVEQKLNVAYYHIEELERIVHGLQDENNKRHAEQDASNPKRIDNIALGEGKLAIRITDLEQQLAQVKKRQDGASERDKAYQTRIELLEDKLQKTRDQTAHGLQHLHTQQNK